MTNEQVEATISLYNRLNRVLRDARTSEKRKQNAAHRMGALKTQLDSERVAYTFVGVNRDMRDMRADDEPLVEPALSFAAWVDAEAAHKAAEREQEEHDELLAARVADVMQRIASGAWLHITTSDEGVTTYLLDECIDGEDGVITSLDHEAGAALSLSALRIIAQPLKKQGHEIVYAARVTE